MNTHAEKTRETKHQSFESKDSQNQKTGHTTSQFVDSRPAAIAQRKLQKATNNSPQVSQLSALQNMASNSPQAQPAAQLQAIANNHASQQQPSELSGQAIQKEENKTGLPDQLKAGMESLSGINLDHVRVHHNSPKPATVQAHAYAQGSDIHLAPDQAKHLPHELGHVVQQAQGRVKPTTGVNGMAVNDSPKLEKEADTMGAKAAQLKPKENKIRAVAGSVAQKKSAVKQGFEFVDNRPELVIQRRVQTLAIDSISQSFQKRVNNETLDSLKTEQGVFQRKVIVNDTEVNIGTILDDVVENTKGRIHGWLVSKGMTAKLKKNSQDVTSEIDATKSNSKATKYLQNNLRDQISSLLVKYDTENRIFEDDSHFESQVIQDVKLVILRLDNIVGIDHHDGQFSREDKSAGGKALRIYRTTTRTDWNTYLQTSNIAGLLHGHGGALGQALDYFYKSKNSDVKGPLYDNVIFEIKFTMQASNAIDYNEISSGGEGGGPKGGKLTGKREKNDILGEVDSFSVNLGACRDLIMSMNPTIRRVDEMKGEESQYSKRLLELALKHAEYPPQSLTDEERNELAVLRDL